jgi:hypothetical protein
MLTIRQPDLKQKPFTCPECWKPFGRQDVLLRHKRAHESQRDEGNQRYPESSPPQMPSVDVDQNGARDTTAVSGFDQSASYDSIPQMGDSNVQNSAEAPVLEQSQSWFDSGDMLEFLMSDLNWPMTLPVMQFQPSHIQRGFNNSVLEALPSHQTGPGHHAMQQMSRLIADLSSSLTAEIESTGITSAFLDTCMHVFFERFIPSFPVLHKATFSVRESSHPLLLNIIALGSLFVGAKDALAKGEALWRLAHTAAATSWQALMATKGPRDSCNGIQLVLTALLGQTYAILSKNESLRMTSQVFHGLGFYWARQCGMYDIEEFTLSDLPASDATEGQKNEAWKSWAAREIQRRAILGHYILDGQISQFSGHSTCARHVINPLLTPASGAAFAATTANGWIMEMQKYAVPQPCFREVFVSLFSSVSPTVEQSLSNFSLRVVLEGLQSLASDIQQVDGPAVGTPSKAVVARALVRLHNERLSRSDFAVENMELLVRWHAICLDLATPTTLLCQNLCQFYGVQQQLHQISKNSCSTFDFLTWSKSIDGLRALLHAMAIQDLVERLPLGRSHAIHLPAAIFSVATIYSARCLAGFPSIIVPKSFRWQDVWAIDMSDVANPDGFRDDDINAFLRDSPLQILGASSTRNLMYDLNSLQITLSSISLRWGVSHAMDDILHRWITIANETGQSNE